MHTAAAEPEDGVEPMAALRFRAELQRIEGHEGRVDGLADGGGDAHDEDMPGPGSPLYDGAIDGGGPSFDVGIYDDGDTFNFGAQAGIADAAMQLGTTPSADRDADTSVRLGGSEGVGFGGRIHHGDADGDGIAEGGFGIDAGPLSLDVRSELIGRAWNWVTQ